MATGPGYARPNQRATSPERCRRRWLGAAPADHRRRRRLWRHHRLPPRPRTARAALRGRGQGHHQRLPGRHRPDRTGLLRPWATTEAALPRRPHQPHPARPGRRPQRAAAPHLAPRIPQEPRQPDRRDAFAFPGDAGTPGQPRNTPERRREPPRMLAHRRMATRQIRTHRLLAVGPAPRHPTPTTGPTRQNPLAHRARLSRTQRRTRTGPLRRPQLHRLAPTRHINGAGPSLLHTTSVRPKSPCAGLTLYAVLRELQTLLGIWTGACRTCGQPVPRHQPDLIDTT